jgi:predicted  nucleic acid-binding Zn-ribbon protein
MATIQDNNRLDRIEEKIDKLADAVVSLARAEEKLLTLEKEHSILMQQIIKLNDRIEITEKNLIELSGSISFASKIFWFVLSAMISSGIGIWISIKK